MESGEQRKEGRKEKVFPLKNLQYVHKRYQNKQQLDKMLASITSRLQHGSVKRFQT
jgi:hypothetical protein